ncbi:MAG TPA: hypothetical protein VLX28_16395, partial [Thermoanaerobaculia bacterium]|nr:hypothetical protein [Thermoanaerobaculia bacterium]
MNPRIVLALLLTVLTAKTAFAEPATVRLTLAEALDRARASSPRLESLTALEAAAEAARRGALAERLPLVDLSGGYT